MHRLFRRSPLSPETMIVRLHAIADELQLDAHQQAAFDEMASVAAEVRTALDPVLAPEERPSTARDMLATAKVWTAAAERALNRLEAPLEAFLATLSDAQLSRFDALVTRRGRLRPRQTGSRQRPAGPAGSPRAAA